MRRRDKEITARGDIEAIIRKAQVCRLAMADENGPYIVPLCFGFDRNTLFFHSAAAGRKLDILRDNPRVCFEFDIDCAVWPADRACEFTMHYKSVIGFGAAVFIDETTAKRRALDVIMRQYAQGPFDYPDGVLSQISVFKIEIDAMSAKASP
jgi:hypothetical protein